SLATSSPKALRRNGSRSPMLGCRSGESTRILRDYRGGDAKASQRNVAVLRGGVSQMSAEHDVFISYSAKNKAIADAVCFALEDRTIRCWIAPRDVRAGIPYAEALIEALDGCRIMVLLLSASSNTSPQVMREVERAASRGAYIIPVRIEDIALSPSLQFFIGP